MALIQATIMSAALRRTVPIQVILPADKLMRPGSPVVKKKPYKTLYLLHGLLGSCVDWTANTRIQLWAEERNLAVVMPSGDNSFYINQPAFGSDYAAFIGEELLRITRDMFPLSERREDTFLAGLSMGGYGTLRNGFRYGENFGCLAALSSAVHMYENTLSPDPDVNILIDDYAFGDLKETVHTDLNPRVALTDLKKRGGPVPKVYMACGTEDYLLRVNRLFRDFLVEEGVELTYEEGPGNHNWAFWDAYIEKVLNWLPLDDAKAGISSGNVNG